MNIEPEFHHFILTFEDKKEENNNDNFRHSSNKRLPERFEVRVSLSLTTDDVLIYFRSSNVEIIGVSDGINDHLTIRVKDIVETPEKNKTIDKIIDIIYSVLIGYARGIGGGEFDAWLDDLDDSPLFF